MILLHTFYSYEESTFLNIDVMSFPCYIRTKDADNTTKYTTSLHLGPSINTHLGGGGQVPHTFLLRITCKKVWGGGGGPDSM